MKKKSKVHEQTTIDHTTGEITSQKTVSSWLGKTEDRFVKLYLDRIDLFISLTKSEIIVYFYLMRYMDYKNRIEIGLRRKKSISNKTGFSLGTVNNAILSLNTKNFIKRVEIGTYIANPEYAGKGNWTAISELRIGKKWFNREAR